MNDNSPNHIKPEVSPPVMGVPLHQHHHQPPQEVPWSTGLFDCLDDVHSCCITCWCPCITFGRVAEIVDKGATSAVMNGAMYGMSDGSDGCLVTSINRTRMRKSFGLQESPCNDCCVHSFCNHLALCQEYRELQNRGFEMKIGWEGNMRRQTNGGVAMAPSAPVVEGGMIR